MRVDHEMSSALVASGSVSAENPAETFTELARRVVGYLTERTPISTWSVNRVDHGTQVHLHVGGDLIHTGQQVGWDDSICRHVMEEGAGPVIRDLSQDPHLADTPWPDQVGSYAGRPIVDADGQLFGMLCGVDADTLRQDEDVDVELLDLFCSLLSAQATLARREVTLAEKSLAATATTDLRTGLLSRSAWDELLVGAATRARAFGDLGAVVMIEATSPHGPLSSSMLHRASSAAGDAAGADESITYLGDGLFASLLDDAAPSSLAAAVRAHRETMTARGLDAVIGWALISPADDDTDVIVRRARTSLEADRESVESDGSLSG